jgi:thiamine biosynthesis lipoprotein
MAHRVTQIKKFMNTDITINVVQMPGDSTIEVQDAIAAGFGEFDRIVQRYTRFSPDSELSNLNRNSGNWTEITPEFFSLIEQMLQLSQATDGAFDPTIIDFLETYGYDPNYDFSKLDKPDLDQLVNKIATTRKSWQDIELNHAETKVKLAPGQRIDLGGIGKGYAIDKAYEHFDQFAHVLIDAGGDVRAKGLRENGQPWSMGLLHKRDDSSEKIVVGIMKASDIAVACSGSWARKVKQFHHLINPATGKPVDEMRTVYISAPTATLADSWATAIFVGGKEVLAKRPAGMEAMLIDKHNQIIKTSGFEFDPA